MLRVVTPSIGPSTEMMAIVSAFRPAGIGVRSVADWGRGERSRAAVPISNMTPATIMHVREILWIAPRCRG